MDAAYAVPFTSENWFMQDNKHFSRQRKPSREAVEALIDMYAKNPNLKTLVKTFDLDIRSAELLPIGNKVENAARQNNSREIIKQYTMSATKQPTSKFNQEIEETELEKFVKFENEGDAVEGVITGEKKEVNNGDKKNNCFVMIVDGERRLLPSNVTLERKLKNLCLIHAETIADGVECRIEYLGMIKAEGVANKMKSFKVLTA